MKILIVAEGFFPGKKYGGPPVSIDNFCSLMNNYECYIITLNHDFGETEKYKEINTGWNDRGNSKVLYLSDDEYTTSTFESVITEISPDIIYLQSLFQRCILPCLHIAKKFNIKVLLAPRGELCKGAFRKKYKKYPYIFLLRILGLLRNVYFQSTSIEETEAINKYIGVKNYKIINLSNIPSIPKQEFSFDNKIPGTAKLIFLSRIHQKKNLIQALKCIKKISGNIVFDIYGSIEDENYWEICKNEIDTFPYNVQVNYCGLVDHDDVHETFSRYDAFLFPTFSENYGHVIIESLLSGCPVIVSDRTPWTSLNDVGAGFVCRLDDTEAFGIAVQKIVDVGDNTYKIRAKEYAQNYLDLNKIKNEYDNAFKSVFKGC